MLKEGVGPMGPGLGGEELAFEIVNVICITDVMRRKNPWTEYMCLIRH